MVVVVFAVYCEVPVAMCRLAYLPVGEDVGVFECPFICDPLAFDERREGKFCGESVHFSAPVVSGAEVRFFQSSAA